MSAFAHLLASKAVLSERDDIQPLFKAGLHLSAYLGTFVPDIGPATELALEFPFFGDYRADLLIGSKAAGHFCVVGFEGGGPDGIFRRQPGRANLEWSTRFEHGFSRLTDWFFNLDDYEKTLGFTKTFGHGHVSFTGLLVIGRSAGLDDMKRARLRWRSGKGQIDSHAVICATYDDILEVFRKRYAFYRAAELLERSLPDPGGGWRAGDGRIGSGRTINTSGAFTVASVWNASATSRSRRTSGGWDRFLSYYILLTPP